jgi:hypothetical protein
MFNSITKAGFKKKIMKPGSIFPMNGPWILMYRQMMRNINNLTLEGYCFLPPTKTNYYDKENRCIYPWIMDPHQFMAIMDAAV